MKIKLTNNGITSNYGENLLQLRGVDDLHKFLKPDETCLQTFKDLENIYIGVGLIDILKPTDKVALIVDSDVDGYTSSAIIYQYLKLIKPDVEIQYFLHSGKQHGLEEHWETLRDEPFNLIIVPDAGTNDSGYADKIQKPILVIDHHLLESDQISSWLTIINNQMSPNYKNKNLSGAGMTYQFCRALDEHFGVDYAFRFIDLAALGIDGDMMSALIVENQYFWQCGFKKINNFFFKTLVEKQEFAMGGKVNPISVAFYIVPHINAMIRMGTEEEKDRLFTALIDGKKLIPSQKRGAKGTMEYVAVESVRECGNAKSHQDKLKQKIVDSLEIKILKHGLLDNKILFIRLDEEDFPPELNGLVAMTLAAKYNKPTIVARLNEEGFVRGSARGLNQSELASFKEFLSNSGYFEYTMGHDNAFGCSIFNQNLIDFHNYANKKLANIDFGVNVYNVDFERKANSNDLESIIYDLEDYKEVWGQDNPQPLLYIKDISLLPQDIVIMGKNQDTIKFIKDGITYIKFRAKDIIPEFFQYDMMRINIVGKSAVNEWRGIYTPQIIIEDFEIFNSLLEF